MKKDLPVHYYNTKNAWFNCPIFHDWFHNKCVHEIKRHQMEDLKIPEEDVKAILLLDNASAYPSEEELVSECGNIRAMFLPPNTTSVIQPMDQGIISVLKRRYTRRYLDEVLVILEDDEALEDTRGEQTLENIGKYNLKSAIFNLASSWRDVKCTTLANFWHKLLHDKADEDQMADFKGLRVGMKFKIFSSF